MLVLARKEGEAFSLIDNLTGETIARISVEKVFQSHMRKTRIGIEADRRYAVVRDDAKKLEPANGRGS